MTRATLPSSPGPGRLVPFPALVAFVLAGLLLALAGVSARPRLSDAERQRDLDRSRETQAAQGAQAALADEERLARARVDAAARLRATEGRLADLSVRLDTLRAREADADARLRTDTAALSPMLPVAERLARFPAETVLAVPLPANDAVRGLLVLRSPAANAAADAARLNAERTELAQLRASLAATLPAMDAARGVQAAQSAQLDAQLAAARTTRTNADDTAAEAARRAAASAARADNLRNALARLDLARPPASHPLPAAPASPAIVTPIPGTPSLPPVSAGGGLGQLLVPVIGSVQRAWGAPTDSGQAQGISFGTPPGARVVSPCTGRVVFAGPFRSYGQLVIVDCGGVHAVLAGPERLDTAVGRQVLAGEPVGVMGASHPSLYVELRRGGRAVDPAPFFRTSPSTRSPPSL